MSQSTAKSEPTRGRSAGDDLELGAAEALSRQADDCRRAGAERAAQREVSAIQACHADNNGQAEPRAAFLSQVGVAHLVERLQHSRHIVLHYPAAVIMHGEVHPTVGTDLVLPPD